MVLITVHHVLGHKVVVIPLVSHHRLSQLLIVGVFRPFDVESRESFVFDTSAEFG